MQEIEKLIARDKGMGDEIGVCYSGIIKDMDSMKAEIKQLKQENEKLKSHVDTAKKALNELGHYGIDFGYGKYDCDVAKIAQEAIKEIEQ